MCHESQRQILSKFGFSSLTVSLDLNTTIITSSSNVYSFYFNLFQKYLIKGTSLPSFSNHTMQLDHRARMALLIIHVFMYLAYGVMT